MKNRIQTSSTSSLPHLRPVVVLVLLASLLVPAVAATEGGGEEGGDAAPSGFLSEFLFVDQVQASKLVSLAKSIPAEKYSWRPAEGVRSVAEVFVHVAQTNFASVQGVTGQLPEGLPADFSQVTEKDQIVPLLEKSFELLQQVGKGMAGQDLTQPAVEGSQFTLRAAIFNHAAHQGEHLGQAIAYARSVGVVPPWSQ